VIIILTENKTDIKRHVVLKMKKKSDWLKNWDLYILILPTVIFFLIFRYAPLYGIQIGFKDFTLVKGIWGSPWIGFDNFIRFFNSNMFWVVIRNTLGINFFGLITGFPITIFVALMLNMVPNQKFKKTVQTITYAPHFISVVVLVGMLNLFLSPRSGLVNQIINFLGGESIMFMGKANWFQPIYIASGIWQSTGWGTILFLATLASVNPELYESAIVDGANKIKRVIYIDIPSLMPTIVILLILNMGNMLDVGFQKVFLMQNDLNLITSEVISTYVYKVGMIRADYSFSTAIGLFEAITGSILLLTANRIAKSLGQSSLW
jgi:putative aldouronate transport system permease protein